MVDVNEPLLMLNFVGLYFLILASLVYNFYQSKKMYDLVESVGLVVAEMGEMRTDLGGIQKRTSEVQAGLDEAKKDLFEDTYYKKEAKKEGTVSKLLREGMELEGREEE